MKTVNFEITDNEKKKKIYDCTYVVIQACVIATKYNVIKKHCKWIWILSHQENTYLTRNWICILIYYILYIIYIYKRKLISD